MSRIGKKPVEIPSGVTLKLEGSALEVKGPKGLLAMKVLDDVSIEIGEKEVVVQPKSKAKSAKSAWGMQRTLVANLVEGVTQGFAKKLEINGVGYRAQMKGKSLNLQLGYSHDIDYPAPDGIDIKTPDQTTVEISGIDKQKVGQVAAEIRSFRPPEPYKGKGVKYEGEYIYRKEGKKK